MDQNLVPEELPRVPGLGHIERGSKTNFIKEMVGRIMTESSLLANSGMFIPCVAMLRKGLYAVAQPVEPRQFSKAINIYDLTGTLKNTLTDRVGEIYDMSSTKDSKLAVLSKTDLAEYCCVKIFDPEVGYIETVVQEKMYQPMSLGVGLQNKYAIHGQNEEKEEQIIIIDKEGKHKVFITPDTDDDQSIFGNNDRITLGGGLIFVKRQGTVDIYKLQGNNLKLVKKNWYFWFTSGMIDISATMWDDLVISNLSGGQLELFGFDYDENMGVPKANKQGRLYQQPLPSNGCTTARVSIRDNHIVMSIGLKFKVFKLEPPAGPEHTFSAR